MENKTNKIVVSFETENDAFQGERFVQEVELVLAQALKRIKESKGGKLRDSYGNGVGSVRILRG